jgi:hypothetical protein
MTMINEVLAVLRDRLEHVLQTGQARADNWVLLGGAGSRGGADSADMSNKIIISLINLQNESSTGAFVAPKLAQDDRYYSSPPALNLDASVMISANFDDSNYEVGLARLSSVIASLQRTPVLTHDSAPDLPAELDKLVIEFVSLDLAQMSNLMTATGAKYAPFALYRLRRLPFSSPAGLGAIPTVRAADAAGGVAGPH